LRQKAKIEQLKSRKFRGHVSLLRVFAYSEP
jgi:hypothetical protein